VVADDQARKKTETDRRYYEEKHAEIRDSQVWARLRQRYGVTRQEYEAKLDEQGHVCAICGEKCKTNQRLCVDHDHDTGDVRGLLCHACNFALGILEKKEWRAKAEAYLAYWVRDL
jgi:hypothetical protein